MPAAARGRGGGGCGHGRALPTITSNRPEGGGGYKFRERR
jgi:hypothetical protein